MNSKECLNAVLDMLNYEQVNECDKKGLLRTIKQDLDRLEKLEKELKQTKLNFRNSQTHSKNHYKKLKEKYEKLEKAYKNNEVMVRDLNELITRNLELKTELNRCQAYAQRCTNNISRYIIDNGKMKKALDILKNKIINLETLNISADLDTYHEILKDNPFYDKLTQEEFKLLKEAFR